ncbi:MAG: carbonic anhydrase [Bacteroides sp.]|nr:carbonic anhydrase [Bacteroides sp.]
MEIKKIIKSQGTRHAIMRLGRFLPDRIMLALQYRLLLHRWPRLKAPQRFNEWIQVYKMSYRNPDMLRCVDKYDVRQYVADKIGHKHLTALYQVVDNAHDIDFKSLPEKFVIKSTSGGNGDNVMIVRDRDALDIPAVTEKINGWLKKNYSDTSREWAYRSAARHPRIIVEEYIDHLPEKGLDDYKFFCFNGKCKFFKVDFNRYTNHQANYYTPDGQLLNVIEGNFTNDPAHSIAPSAEISEMVILAEKLSADFPFVRVDLYNNDNRIIFGEMTFYPASGYTRFIPDDFDYEAGKYFPGLNDAIWTKYSDAGK